VRDIDRHCQATLLIQSQPNTLLWSSEMLDKQPSKLDPGAFCELDHAPLQNRSQQPNAVSAHIDDGSLGEQRLGG